MSIKKRCTAIALSSLLSASLFVGGAWAQKPTTPEAMSGKTALQFFADNEIKAGVNLGNRMDATNSAKTAAQEGAWGAGAVTQAYVSGLKESGIDIVRIPITWIGKFGAAPEYTLDAAWLDRAEEIVNYARTAGIKAMIINIHHDGHGDDGMDGGQPNGWLKLKQAKADPNKKTEIQNQLAKMWTQIANRFKNYGESLIFEVMNEVHSGDWGCTGASCATDRNILFDWKQAALDAIRATGGNNATRYVAFPGLGSTEPYHVTDAHTNNKLLPVDVGTNGTNKMIVSVHFYQPWRYTVANVTNQTPGQTLNHEWKGTGAPGESSEEKTTPTLINNAFNSLKTTFIDKGIAVYVGEWGAQTNVRSTMSQQIKDDHIEYISTVAGAISAHGAVPIYWDDGGNFHIFNKSTGRPVPGFHTEVYNAMMTAIGTTPTDPPKQGQYDGAKSPIALPTSTSGWEAVSDKNNTGEDGTGASVITITVNGGTMKAEYTLSQGTYVYDPYVTAKLLAEPDLSSCGWGIGYSYKGSAHALRAVQSDVTNYNFHSAAVTAAADWTAVTLPWSDFEQENWGEATMPLPQDRNKVTSFEWFVKGADGASGAFEVKDVYCLQDAGWTVSIRHGSSRTVNTVSARPMVAVRGRVLNVSSPDNSALSVRMIDVRGKVRARFNASGSGNFSLAKIPAGRYFVDVSGAGIRQTSAVIVR